MASMPSCLPTFNISLASSAVILCSLVSLSVSDIDVAFETPAASAPCITNIRERVSQDEIRDIQQPSSVCAEHLIHCKCKFHFLELMRTGLTLIGLPACFVECLAEYSATYQDNLHNDFWCRLMGSLWSADVSYSWHSSGWPRKTSPARTMKTCYRRLRYLSRE